MISNELLKKRILDYAFHGNLIDNDSILKPVSISEVESNIPYEIPSNWKWIKYSDITENKMGKTILFSDLIESGIPVYSATQCDDIFGYVKESAVLLHSGDIVIPARGNSIGFVTLVKDELATCTQTTIYSHITSDEVLPEFLTYCCKCFRTIWFKHSGAAIPQVTVGQINKNLVPVPPLEEQKKIVEKIDELFALLEKKEVNDQEKEKLKEVLKSKILDSAIHGTLVDNDSNLKPIEVEEVKDDITFDIPSNWKWTKWRNLSSSIQYGVSASATDSGNAKLVRITDIQNNEVVWNSVPFCKINEKDIEKYLLKENDILFARTGGTVGKSVMVKNIPDDSNYVFAGYLIRSNYDEEKVFYKYLKIFMDSSLYWKQLRNGSIGMAQANCNGKTLGNMLIPLPPLEEQKRIVEKIESLFELIEQL